jgi:hypothetical protein
MKKIPASFYKRLKRQQVDDFITAQNIPGKNQEERRHSAMAHIWAHQLISLCDHFEIDGPTDTAGWELAVALARALLPSFQVSGRGRPSVKTDDNFHYRMADIATAVCKGLSLQKAANSALKSGLPHWHGQSAYTAIDHYDGLRRQGGIYDALAQPKRSNRGRPKRKR